MTPPIFQGQTSAKFVIFFDVRFDVVAVDIVDLDSSFHFLLVSIASKGFQCVDGSKVVVERWSM